MSKKTLKSLLDRIARLEESIHCTPRMFRKDVERVLGISASTLTRRMQRRDFPRPIYDAGRPKWMPCQFNGQGGKA